MPDNTPPETFETAQNVDMFIDREIQQVDKYENRNPYDGEFAYTLHQLAACIYGAGHRDGKVLAEASASRERGREFDRERRRVAELTEPEALKPDQVAELVESWFSNVCVNDAFEVEFGRPAPCGGEHGGERLLRTQADVTS